MAQSYTFTDQSGIDTSSHANPYDALLEACHNDAHDLQNKYETHRNKREAQQNARLLSPELESVTIDETLRRLEQEPGFQDPRRCLVFWARPPKSIIEVITRIQTELRKIIPNIWLMPSTCLHMTALEIAHSLTDPDIEELTAQLQAVAPTVVEYTYTHRARVFKPKITYDAQAIALSFLPAAGGSNLRNSEDDNFTYHHLRRDLYNLCTDAGVKVASRYIVPSAHLTIARYIYNEDFEIDEGNFDKTRMSRLIQRIEELNQEMEETLWPDMDGKVSEGGEWIIGEAKGLDYRKGDLWYGGGSSLLVGKGF